MIRVKICRLLLLGTLMCFQSLVLAVSVKINQNTIGMNETVTLTYETKNLNNASVNFSAITRDFNIIEQSNRSSVSIINGRVTSSVIYTLVLKPLRTGVFSIPPVRFGNEKSASVIIKVKKRIISRTPIGGSEYFSEIVITPEKPFVQQEADMVLRIYSTRQLRMNRADIRIDKFNIPSKDALLKKFNSGKSFYKKLNGQTYHVYEYRYKIFPQHSGSFTIPALKTRLLHYSRRSRYYGGRRRYRGNQYTSTKIKKVIVKPRPQSYKGRHWLPAVKISLSDVWNGNPQQILVGGSVTRTVTIEALGLTSAQLPEINLVMPQGIKAYKEKAISSDRKDTEHIRSTRKVKILFLPTRAGTYTIPAIKLYWWNVKTGKEEVASLPARTLQVIARQAATKPGNQPKTGTTPKTGTASPDIPPPDKSSISRTGYSVVWVWLSAFLLVAWIFTMMLWWLSLNREKPLDQKSANNKSGRSGPPITAILNSEQTLQKMVRQSCENQQPLNCRKALLDWSRLHWPKSFPTSLTQIAERLHFDAFVIEIDRLNELLYADDESTESHTDTVVEHWDGNALWLTFSAAVKQRQAQAERESSPLASLYPD